MLYLQISIRNVPNAEKGALFFNAYTMINTNTKTTIVWPPVLEERSSEPSHSVTETAKLITASICERNVTGYTFTFFYIVVTWFCPAPYLKTTSLNYKNKGIAMAPKKEPVTKRWKGNRATLQHKTELLLCSSEEEMETNFRLINKNDSIGRNCEPEEGTGLEDEDVAVKEGSDEEWNNRKGSSEDEDGKETTSDSDSDGGRDRGHRGVGHNQIQSENNIKKELSTMSFEDIMNLQKKVGTKVYNEVAYGEKTKPRPEKKKRLSKNRPVEISAKQPAPFLRQVVPVKKKLLRDPRFDDLSGEYKPEIFEKTYSFISDIKQKEKKDVQNMLKKVKQPNKKEQLQLLLKRMENQESTQESRALRRQKELEFKKQQRQFAEQGHRPFFLKKSEKRKLELAEKYSDLKRSGKLENFLNKKRKRNAMKDRRKLPFSLKPQ
ncbi:hypothetical protein GN956_G12470 [Arapaima gigas]